MDTKHISDKSDPSTLDAKVLHSAGGAVVEGLSEEHAHRLGFVAGEPAEVVRGAKEESAAPAAAEAAVHARSRAEFGLHPLAGRIVPYWRRRR